MAEANPIPNFIRDDLADSGLTVKDIGARPLGAAEKHATGAPQNAEGYVIPYYDMDGKALPFYRAKILNGDPKYRQLANEPNHIYFPKGFKELVADADYILFVEGEKKAACAVKKGFAACAAGGVDSWSNKTLTLPKDAKLTKGKDGRMIAKLPAGLEEATGQDDLANGMQELIDLLVRKEIPLVIIYDSDDRGRVKFQVQAAAARLGYMLRFRGVAAKNIRQFILRPPPGYTDDKLALDDLLIRSKVTPKQFDTAIHKMMARPSAFPRHPNPKDFVNKKLRRTRMAREQLQSLATSILCDLDANGSRLYSEDEDELYYFSRTSKRLMRVSFNFNQDFAKSDWGTYLYQNYNLSSADERVLVWLEAQFAGEQPVHPVEPERVIAVRDHAIYYQISAAQMIKVSADEIRVLDNGSDDILFMSDAVEDLNKPKLVKAINDLMEEKKLPNYWLDVIKRTYIADDKEYHQAKLLSYLYSISPWFYRWKGTQLPFEMIIGEPGSGKSTLYEIRLSILNGRARLRNPAKDIVDWGVSVGSTGALHVTDNVNMQNSQLRQMISDEMCRLITEPHPMIEKRKLYTDNDLVLTPVKTVFAVTAVKQPFGAADIIQRSVITYMNKSSEVMVYQGDWASEQLAKFGDREGWIAQQLVFVQRMLQKVEKEWNQAYRAKLRLINVEQLLRFAADLYGDPEGSEWMVPYMEDVQSEKIAENDIVLGALRKFSELVIEHHGEYNRNSQARFMAKDISEWANREEDFNHIHTLTNSRTLGKFLRNNPNLLATVAGITEFGTKSNAITYIAHRPKK